MVRARIFGLPIVAFAIILCASVACADSVTVDDVQFTAVVTSTTVTLDVQCLDITVCGSWYLGDVTVKALTFTGTPTLGTAPSGYTLLAGGQNNSAVGTGGGCNSTQPGSAVCWDAALPLTTQLGSGVIEFTANITGGAAGDGLAVQATAYNNSSGDGTGGGKVLAVSSAVPEPSSFALLGLGLLGLAVVGRRALPVSQV